MAFFFPAVHSVLDPQALLSEVVAQYELGQPSSCVLLRSWINEVYQLQSGGETYILKLFRFGWRSADEVRYEAALSAHLAAHGLRVAPPVARRDGDVVALLPAPEGPRPMALFPLLAGRPPLPPSEAIYQQVGEAIAMMHQALDTFESPLQRRPLDFGTLADEPLAWLRPHLADRAADWSFLAGLVERARARVDALGRAEVLDWGPIHGDATLGNLVLTADEQVGMFDFDQSGPGWRGYELQGVFQYAWAVERPGFWTALLDGYRAVRPLGPADLAALPCFVVLNRLWCMGFEAHVVAGNRGRWIVDRGYFDEALGFLRRWAAAHPELAGLD